MHKIYQEIFKDIKIQLTSTNEYFIPCPPDNPKP
jgi:hypothetical protein